MHTVCRLVLSDRGQQCGLMPVACYFMTTANNPAAAVAIRHAQDSARSLRGRFVTARVAGDSDELASVAAQALAACDALVLAVPAVEPRHVTWLVAVSRRLADAPTGTLARVAVNHLARLAAAASRPAVLADPSARFAGSLDEPVVTRP